MEHLSVAFLSVPQTCPFGCTYCFAKFPEYKEQLRLDSVLNDPEQVSQYDLIYPACDVDFFALSGWQEMLPKILMLGKHVSISTKARLRRSDTDELADIIANHGNRKVVKISVSICALDSARAIEPRTPTPEVRLTTLQNLTESGILSSLALKPILSDVPVAEYSELLERARNFTELLLVGDEWVSVKNPRQGGDGYIEIHAHPRWNSRLAELSKRIATQHRDSIYRTAADLKYLIFETDRDLVGEVIEQAKGDISESGH